MMQYNNYIHLYDAIIMNIHCDRHNLYALYY